MQFDLQKLVDQIQAQGLVFLLNVVAAAIIFFVGRWVSKLLRTIVENGMRKAKADELLVSFIGNLTYFALLVFVVIAALGELGVKTTQFIAVIGAAGLAIGLALQGSLSNFAAGFLMIIFRPFKVGDLIEGAGVTGVVDEIQIFSTMLRTPDNKRVIIPNSAMSSGNIINYSTLEKLRIDLVFGIGYGDNIDDAKKVLMEIISSHPKVLADPAPFVGVAELADSSVNFAVRPWVKVADYWDVYFDIHEAVKKQLDAHNISIPFPQRDVHMIQDAG
jgi:small conductance mechanosensitive channel